MIRIASESRRTQKTKTEPIESARAAGLRYTTDTKPGLGRRRSGKGFRYVDAAGKAVRDAETLRRIRSLVVPPAWTDVWICPIADGHLQATGRDARGRKQYRYHPRWRSVRDETKYGRMIAFAHALPAIRRRHGEQGPGREARPAPREGPGGPRPAPGDDPRPRRQRRIRPREPVVRPDHDARSARRRRRFEGPLRVPGQERCRTRDRPGRQTPGEGRRQMPRPAWAGVVPVRRRRGRGPRRRLRRRQRLPPRDQRAGLHRQGLPHLGRHGPRRDGLAGVRGVRLAGAGPQEHRPGDRERRRPPGEHAERLPEVLRPPGRAGQLPRRLDGRDPPPTGRARSPPRFGTSSRKRRPSWPSLQRRHLATALAGGSREGTPNAAIVPDGRRLVRQVAGASVSEGRARGAGRRGSTGRPCRARRSSRRSSSGRRASP